MHATKFRKGDRVMSRVAVGAVRVGAQGTILGRFPNLDNTYDVVFDETPVAHIFQAHMLSALPAAHEQRGTGVARHQSL